MASIVTKKNSLESGNGSSNSLKRHRKADSNGHGEVPAKLLLEVLKEVRNGNFSVRLPEDEAGVAGKIYDTLNDIIDMNEKMMLEFTKARNTIGREGKLNQRIMLPSTKGSWSEGVNSLNELISDLVFPTIEIASVISSV